MIEDPELLRRYAEDRAESAFAEIVRRHVDLVYSAALRQVNGDAHLAQDVTQLVFTDLARKAHALARHRVLAGWLFTSTRYAAAKLVRGEQRRRTRETEAELMREILHDDGANTLDWARVRPVLDAALAELGEEDREAVLLRFFEGRDYAGVGVRLGLGENAARMRVERAVEKLRAALDRRGVRSTGAALALALAGQAVTAAPAGLAASVTGLVLAGGGAAAAGSWATFMSMTKLQLGIAGALAVAGSAGWVMQAQSNADLRAEIAALRPETQGWSAARAENLRLKRAAGEVAALRDEGATLDRLSEEAAALQVRMRDLARAEAARAADAGAYDVSKLDQAPRPRFQARPNYPAALRLAGITGTVVVDFIVDANGDVRNPVATKSTLRGTEPVKGDATAPGTVVKLANFEVAGDGVASLNGGPAADAAQLLAAAAVEAVTQWKFDPGQKGGRVVNTRLQVPIMFTLANGKSQPAGGAKP
jgi:RNA polymerase sigma factor (sigma-70 family)